MTLFIRIFGIRNRFNFQFRPIKVMQPISATHSHSHCRRSQVDESKTRFHWLSDGETYKH